MEREHLPPANKPGASALTDHLGYWLRMVSNSVSSGFARRMDTSGVTVAEWVILRELYDAPDGIAPGVLADRIGSSPGTVSRLIDRLVRKRLVSRAASAVDRRTQTVRITEQAVLAVPRLASLADQNDAWFFSVLSGEERHRLLEILQRLARHHRITTIPIE